MIDIYRGRFILRNEKGLLAGVAMNSRLYSWGWAASRLFQGDASFKIATLYVEFKNVASPGDAITNPTFQRQDGLDYYEDLASSPNTDYLRLRVGMPTVDVVPGYESYFRPGEGNMLIYTASTGGAVGVHGKPFSAEANSKVYGAALAASPFINDRTQDVLIARGYYPQGQHLVKQPTGQLEITYQFPFE